MTRGALTALLLVASLAFAQPYTPGVQVKQGTSLIGQCPTLNFDSTDFSFTKSGSTCTGQLGADIPHTGPYDDGTNFDPANGVTSVPAVPFNFSASTLFTLPTAVSFGGLSYTLPSSRTDSQCLKTGSGGTQGTLTWGSCGSGGLSNPATIGDASTDGTLYGASGTTHNLTLDANSADQTGTIYLDSAVKLWPTFPSPTPGNATINLILFDRAFTYANSSNPLRMLNFTSIIDWARSAGQISVVNFEPTITQNQDPGIYTTNIFRSVPTVDNNGGKPMLPDTVWDGWTSRTRGKCDAGCTVNPGASCTVHADCTVCTNGCISTARTESAYVAVSVVSEHSFQAAGSNYTLAGNTDWGADGANDAAIFYRPAFGASGTSTLTYSSTAAAVYVLPPFVGKDAGATLTLSGRIAGIFLEDVLNTTPAAFTSGSSVYSKGANVTLINAGPAYIGAEVDPAGTSYKLGVGGHLYLDNNTNTASELRFREPDGASHTETSYVGFKAPALAANLIYVLPATDPTAGQVLSSTAPSANVATLSWVSPSETKCMTIDQPVDTDDVIWFKNQSGATITLTSANCIVAAATNARVQIKECDVNAANCGNSHTAVDCTTSNTPITLTDTAVDSTDWMRVAVTATSGSPGHVTVCLTYSGAS